MAKEGGVLVVGADGTLGASVAARLEAGGVPVVRTSRRGTPGSMTLDLEAAPASWELPSGVTSAVLCAAITATDACRDRPGDCRRVNVEATLDLGRRLTASGSRIVFPSTNMVFDGSMPFTPPSTPWSPRTSYGRMKAEAEEGLLALGGTTVVRLTKVVGRTLPVFMCWREALDRGEPIRPLADLSFAPVRLDLAAAVVAAAARAFLGPVLQVSARADVSYAAVASRLASRWGAAADLVRPATVAELGLRLEHVPRNTTLDASTVRDRLGVEPPEPWAAIDEVA